MIRLKINGTWIKDLIRSIHITEKWFKKKTVNFKTQFDSFDLDPKKIDKISINGIVFIRNDNELFINTMIPEDLDKRLKELK